MFAALLTEVPTRQLTITSVASPQPQAGAVRIAVEACGICGTDIHILDGESYTPELPFVMGHEPCGTVVEVVDNGDESWLGRRVVPHIFVGCRTCDWCVAGDDRLCRSAKVVGVLGLEGAFAEQLVVPTSHCVAVPEQLGATAAASLVDSGATAHNAWRTALRHSASCVGSDVVIVGGGPVGQLVAELARTSGRRARVVEPSPIRRAVLERVGHQTAPSLGFIEEPSVVIDCSGSPAVLPWALESMRPRGVFVVVGYSTTPSLDSALIARKEIQVVGVRSGSRDDLVSVMDAAVSSSITLPPITLWPLAEINHAFNALRSGAVAGKSVITFAQSLSPT